MERLDEIDIQLLELLQRDSKQTTKYFALQLNLSTTAVFERIKKLERQGIIKKYVALIDAAKVNRGFIALCHIRLSPHSKENVDRFEREIVKLSEVTECLHTSGEYDYILKVHVKDMQAYRAFLVDKLTALQHIGSTHSSFVIKEVKKSSVIDLGGG